MSDQDHFDRLDEIDDAIYAEWKDIIPDWQSYNGTLYNETNSSSLTVQLGGNGKYSDWETLEQDYYLLFNELKN